MINILKAFREQRHVGIMSNFEKNQDIGQIIAKQLILFFLT